ncbi:MFS transporter [Candidimonas nitroreducens]|uniref:Major facilitator superfamily (MFS) profile domain-containing protein n=1 Tax=Candidimonas nitroreducens TaxID=683354 RepID=A0A225M689_9BURK|nr:hypothetical protein [Candidimonas nitroreducens]OWT56837.1 hypothetical protein CEY11_18330 [Candidimonas nitroreducens]
MAGSRPRHFVLIAAVALIGLNLRPFITGIGPLAGSIHEFTGLGLQGMALLTLVPMLLMGVLAFVGPALESAIGARRAVILALLIICAGSAGLLAILAISQALAALTLPLLASKHTDRRPWLWFTLAMQALGFTSLAFAPGLAPHVLAAILGMGLGGCFALSLIVALDHLPDPAQAGALTALMQGGGFIIAAVPAWLVAALHDLTASYKAGWFWHLVCVGLVVLLTVRFTPSTYASAMLPLDTGHPRGHHLSNDRLSSAPTTS